MFRLFNIKITVFLLTDILEQIHHEIQIIILNEVKPFKLIMNSLYVWLWNSCYRLA